MNTTAQSILQIARHIFETEGAGAVSMRRVAEQAGISAMAIYRHFENREALLQEIADAGFAELAGFWTPKRTRQSPLKQIEAMLGGYMDYALAHPRIFDYMFAEPRPSARKFPEDFRKGRSPTGNLLAQAVTAGIDAGVLARDNVWDVSMALWAHAHGLICLYRGGRFSYDEAAFRKFYRRSLQRLIHGLRAN
ncbi:TetR family transcriptional regulator [Ahniella affigens]|uniref:TetR family transcriptional regulator n=1 Tax=Ahniella affigens TaxID=2021234 RepID=A0A2P1PN11_9GAMM|nr:TetR/AcrR family transcriptional regulator [Ahniella affigens]AVP96231.1 TetR family transcriptional regulator [Ahniella affigens]